jgi:hypothetical protein
LAPFDSSSLFISILLASSFPSEEWNFAPLHGQVNPKSRQNKQKDEDTLSFTKYLTPNDSMFSVRLGLSLATLSKSLSRFPKPLESADSEACATVAAGLQTAIRATT